VNAYQDHASLLDSLVTEQAEAKSVFSWNGSMWNILPGGAKFKRVNSIGGYDIGSDLQLTCTSAQFAALLPQAGDQFIYTGDTYTIETVTTPVGGYQIRIHANLTVAES